MTITKILVAHDFSDASNRALSFAARLGQDVGARIEVVHVHPDLYDGRGDLLLTLPAASPGHAERYLRFLEQELQSLAKRVVAADHDITCRIVRGDPVKGIEADARTCGADLVCVGATGKGAVDRVLLGSVSQLLLRTSAIPVLVVP